MSIAEEKARLRLEIRGKLALLGQEYIDRSDELIYKKLVSLPQYIRAKTVFAYASVGREVSTEKFLERVLEDGKRLALPQTLGGGMMVFRSVTALSELKAGRYGIPEPDESAKELMPDEGDIVIVPALCCDKNGGRLGHGAGYYDRYLEAHPAYTVCLCRKSFLLDAVPIAANDIPVKLVLTDGLPEAPLGAPE